MSLFTVVVCFLFFLAASVATFTIINLARLKDKFTKLNNDYESLNDEIEKIQTEKEEVEYTLMDLKDASKLEIENLRNEVKESFEKGKDSVTQALNNKENEIVNIKNATEKFSQEIQKANQTIKTLKQKYKNIDIERHKILLSELNENVNLAQDENLKIIENKGKTADFVFSTSKQNNFLVSFEEIIEKTGMDEGRHFLQEKFKPDANQDEEKILYIILIGTGGNITLIDGKFSTFLEKNVNYLDRDNDKIRKTLKDTLQERVDFLSSAELHATLKNNLEKLDNIRSVDDINVSVYIPSELILEKLAKNVDNFAEIIQEASVLLLTPASLTNVSNQVKYLHEAENNVIKYQIISDIIGDFNIDNLDISDTDFNNEIDDNNTESSIANADNEVNSMFEDLGFENLDLNDLNIASGSDNTDIMIDDFEIPSTSKTEQVENVEIDKDQDNTENSGNANATEDIVFELDETDSTQNENIVTTETANIQGHATIDPLTKSEDDLDLDLDFADDNNEDNNTSEQNNAEDDLDLDLDFTDKNNEDNNTSEQNNAEDDLDLDLDFTDKNNEDNNTSEQNNAEDDLDLDLDFADKNNEDNNTSEQNNAEDDLDLDLDFADDNNEDNNSSEQNNTEDDLDLDLDIDEEDSQENSAKKDDDDDFDLDLDLDFADDNNEENKKAG